MHLRQACGPRAVTGLRAKTCEGQSACLLRSHVPTLAKAPASSKFLSPVDTLAVPSHSLQSPPLTSEPTQDVIFRLFSPYSSTFHELTHSLPDLLCPAPTCLPHPLETAAQAPLQYLTPSVSQAQGPHPAMPTSVPVKDPHPHHCPSQNLGVIRMYLTGHPQ